MLHEKLDDGQNPIKEVTASEPRMIAIAF